ncbi:uncharacterized protein LOC124490664 [Dermatophagoides farinae]|uniref:uncharacterized protein LOC124490664 n=1 Tax=Dermatophagoides farinae TaxID=6954 RepID=UPI003F5EE143
MADTDKDTTTFFTKQDDDDDDDDVKSESIFEQQQQQQSLKYDRIIRRRGIKSKKPSSAKQQQEIRQLKAGLLMSIWKNLMIIRVSKSLPQKEFYLRMAEIQTTHRRIVLVHCDKRTMKRVIHNGRELDLFNGEKIWILLDGRLGPDEKFDTISSSSSSSWFNGDGDGVNGKQDDDHHMDSVNDNDQLPLPVGMLAIQNRHRKIYDPELLDSIVELMGKAALNSYQLRLLQKQYPKSRTLFQNQKQINNNNNNHNNKKKPFGYYTSSAFKSSPSSLSLISNNSSSSSSSSIVTKPTSSLPMKPFNDDKKQRENLKQKKSSTSTLLHSLSSLSSVNTGCIDSAANYTNEQIDYRIDILRELQKLLNPILARYRHHNRFSRCSQQWPWYSVANNNKHHHHRKQQQQQQQQQPRQRYRRHRRTTTTTTTTIDMNKNDIKNDENNNNNNSNGLANINNNNDDSITDEKKIFFASSAAIKWNHNHDNHDDDSKLSSKQQQQQPLPPSEAYSSISTQLSYGNPTIFSNIDNDDNDDDIDIQNDYDDDGNDGDDDGNDNIENNDNRQQNQFSNARLQRRNLFIMNDNDVKMDLNVVVDDDDDDEYYYYDDDYDDYSDDDVDHRQQREYNDNKSPDVYDDDDDDNDNDNDMFTLDMYRSIVPHFDILNLIPVDMSSESIITTTATTNTNSHNTAHSIASSSSSSSFMNQSGNRFVKSFSKNKWHKIGNITYDQANLNTIMYIGMDKLPNYVLYATNMNHQKQYHHYHHHHQHHQQQQNIVVDNNEEMTVNIDNIDDDHFTTLHMSSGSGSGSSTSSSSGKPRFRVVTNIAPPFVIESTKLDNNTCLIGDFCLKVLTNVRDDLISIFTDFRSQRRQFEGHNYQVNCCAGIAIDLLNAVARDLHFDYDLYLVADGLFGIRKDGKWDGVTADLVNDVAHLSFTAFSTTSSRVQAIDYSVPFFYSGVSCLSSVSSYSDVRLLAFLIPFSYELWAAIFASLVATAIAAAIYEWFSPFGLNPWGRQRTKNFSLASALWVMCSLLFSHLVAFKAPKSWPNKVLINVWGAFSVIFLATYTANIAAHFAGFLLPEVNDFHDSSLMKQRTGTARSSASEGYLMEKYTELWHHIQRYKVDSFDAGLESLRNDKLDVLIGDTAILDYYRANDPGCNLRLLGDSIFDDAYAIGMQKGFPFRESISNLILKYNEYGFLDQLHRKWYGRVHCLESTSLSKPEPLTVRGVAGVFLMLTIGILVGIIILLAEHFTFKYLLPGLRKKPKDCFWKSPNLMFFSQKLYRFINTVELVSPHHSAKEIITNLREGQIASLFQKSVKRKAKEEARRRKSKSQFFEMIQEVRKVVHLQQTERSMQQDDDDHDDNDNADDDDDDDDLSSSDLIDEEAALNTNTNMRVTRPSFSLSKDELIEMEFNHQNRVSSIRFREPNDMNHDTIYHPPSLPPAPPPPPPPSSSSSVVERKSKSNLKISNESKKLNSSTDSQQDVIVEHAHRLRYHQRRRRSSSSSTQRHSKQMETVQSRRKKLLQTHTHSTSFSLENICFEGILSEGISDQNEKRKNFRRRRILSFEDLPAIKKELSESSQEGDHYSMIESEQYRHYTTKSIRPIRKSKLKSLRHQTMTTSLSSSSSAAAAAAAARSIDIGRLSRNEILNLWNSSEKELLNRLEMTIQQNRVLEEKIKLLQRMLKKPP